jgi:hypothetical protein
MRRLLRALFFLAVLVLGGSVGFAADVSLKWDPSEGATGYKVQKSLDLGVTWSTGIDVGSVTTFVFKNVEENVLVLFRASAYNAAGESIRTWSGAWFDARKKPVSPPSGQGIE